MGLQTNCFQSFKSLTLIYVIYNIKICADFDIKDDQNTVSDQCSSVVFMFEMFY